MPTKPMPLKIAERPAPVGEARPEPVPEAEACPEDPVLLAFLEGRLRGEALEALDEHLDGCSLCRALIAELRSGVREKRAPASVAPQPGAQVGRFRILSEIGQGAMGAVFAARDPELDRRVALKLLHAERSDEKARARLLREAQAMARLSHPSVVTVHEVGTYEGEVWVAMELLEGETLRAWLATDPPVEERLRALREAGEGLAAAHRAGLVHRDFKPENVLLDPEGRAKVGDFGLAVGRVDAALEGGAEGGREEPTEEPALLEASLTRTGALLGTPAYMAPEQLRGEAADARADQFAFAVTCWEALAGRRPFRPVRSLALLEGAIAEGPEEGLPPTSLDPSQRRALEAALRRALSPAREDRFPTVEALLEALREALREAPEIRPQEAPRARLWVAGGGLAVLGLLLIGAAWGALGGRGEAPQGPCEGVAEAADRSLGAGWRAAARASLPPAGAAELEAWAGRWAGARAEVCEATHLRHVQSEARMDLRMSCLDRQRGAFLALTGALRPGSGGDLAEAAEALPDPEACVSQEGQVAPPSAEDAEAVAGLRAELDRARLAAQMARRPEAQEEARASAAALLERARAIGYAPLVAEAGRLLAEALQAQARFEEALEAANAGVLAATASGDDREAAWGWLGLTRAAGAAGHFDEARDHARHAEAAIARLGEPIDLLDELRRTRGVLFTQLGELLEAEAELRAALRSMEERYGAESPRLASLHSSLGELLRVGSRLEEALAAHERALALDRAALGEDHPRVGRDLHNLGGILRRLERRAEASERYREALRIKRAALGDDHPETALTRNSLGLLAYEGGDAAEARREWEAALPVFVAHRHGDEALVSYNLALLERDAGRWAEALERVDRALVVDAERIGPRAKRVGSEQVVRARILLGLQRFEEAREAAERGLSIAEELGDPPLVADARAALAEADRSLTPAPAPPPAQGRARPAAAPVEPGAIEPATIEPAQPPPPDPPALPRRPTGSGAYGAGQAWEQ